MPMNIAARRLAAREAVAADVPTPEIEGTTPETTQEALPSGPAPMEQMEAGISMIEEAIAGLQPALAERARSAIEALREVVTESETAGEGAAELPLDRIPKEGGA